MNRSIVVAFIAAGVLSSSSASAEPLPVLGAEFTANSTWTGDQGSSYHVENRQVGRAPDGRFVIVWEAEQDGDQESINGQLYNADGTKNGSEFLINAYTTSRQRHPAVAMQSDGKFVVSWESLGIAPPFGGPAIAGRHFDSDGTPLGGQFLVSTYAYPTSIAYSQISVSPIDDSFVVVWYSQDADHDQGTFGALTGRQFDASAAPAGTEFAVNTYTTGNQSGVSACHSSDGTFTASWLSHESPRRVMARRFDTDATALTGDIEIENADVSDIGGTDVGCFSDGAFMVVWTENAGTSGVLAHRHDAAGAPSGTEFHVDSDPVGPHMRGAIDVGDDDSYVVVWTTGFGGDGDGWGVEARRFDAADVPDGDTFVVNSYTPGDQIKGMSVALDALNDFVVTWHDPGVDGDGEGVLGKLYCNDENNNLICDSDEGVCKTAPETGCITGAKGSFLVKAKDPAKALVKWKLVKGAAQTQADLGTPTTDTGYSLCAYDEDGGVPDLALSLRIDPSLSWESKDPKGWQYKDKPGTADGVQKIKLKNGIDTKSKAQVIAKGINIPALVPATGGAFYLLDTKLTVQLVNAEGTCWSTEFTTAKKNTVEQFKAVAP